MSGLDGINALVVARDIVVSGIDSYKSGDNTSVNITFEVFNSDEDKIDTVNWVTGDGDSLTLGTITIPLGTKRYADGTYTLKMTGVSQGITTTRDITGLVIDAINPTIGIVTFDLVTGDPTALKVVFEISDLNLKTATAILRLDGSDIAIETVDVKDKTEVVFENLESGKTYEIKIDAEDNAGNKNTWSGKRAIDALSPTVEIVSIYNMTHRRFTGELKYGNKNGGNLTLAYGYYNTNDNDNPIATYSPPILTPAQYASNQYWSFVTIDDGLLPDTEYVLKVSATNADSKKTTVSTTFRVGKLPEIVTTPNASLLSQTKFTTDYEYKHVVGDGRLFTAELINVASGSPVDLKVMDAESGTLSFTGLAPDTDYRLVYRASGQLYSVNFVVGNQTFKTMPSVTLEYTPVTDLSSHKQFVTEYNFRNMAGSSGHTFTAELFDVVLNIPAEFKLLSGNSGTITFTNLEPGSPYRIRYQATGPLYDDALQFSDQTFTTLYTPTITMEGVDGLLTKDSNTVTYGFQNIAGDNTYSAVLKLTTNNNIVDTVTLSKVGSVKFSNLTANTGYVISFQVSGALYNPPLTFDRGFMTKTDVNPEDWWEDTSNVLMSGNPGGGPGYSSYMFDASAFTGVPSGTYMSAYTGNGGATWTNLGDWGGWGTTTAVSTTLLDSNQNRQKAINAILAAYPGSTFIGVKSWS